MPFRVLVTGASVAGNAAAWWLTRQGHDVTVVERAPGFRDGGQNIDVRGNGREVLRRMGLEQAVVDHGTREAGTAWVDGRNRTLATIAAHDQGFTAELEILRGDLARLLHEAARERAAYRFGDRVVALDQDDAGVSVTFGNDGRERFDLVVVAEGVGSATREMLFAGENDPRWIGLTTAYFTIPKGGTDDDLWRIYNAEGGLQVATRPDNKGTTRANLVIRQPPGGENQWDAQRQKAFLRSRFADAGWETPRILDGMDRAGDFYFEVLRQVRMKRYSAGRVVLLGDAAWCPTPMSGIGTTLAIVGAYVLASELARAAGHEAAFAAYERYMRPFVRTGQGVPGFLPKLMLPRSGPGVAMLRGVMRLVDVTGAGQLAARSIVRNAKPEPLPDYGATNAI